MRNFWQILNPTFFIFLFLLSQPLSAQFSVGIETGFTKNYLLTNTSSLPFTAYKPVSGYSVGAPVAYKFNNWFSIASGINITQKNYKYVRSGFFDGVYESYHNSYLQIPLMGHFSFGGARLRGFLNLGMYAAYWANGSIQGTIPNILNPMDDAFFTSNPTSIFGESKSYSFNQRYSFNSTRDNRHEYGWILGMGLSYQLSERFKPFVEVRNMQALSNHQKNYMMNGVSQYNQTYGIAIGCMVRLSGIHSKEEKEEESSTY